MRLLPLTLLLAACPPGEGPPVSNGIELTAEPAGVAVHAVPGAAPLSVLVRQVDARGAAVGPAGDVTVSIGGTDRAVRVDEHGFGTVTVDEVGVVAAGGLGQDTLHVMSADLPDVGLPGYDGTDGPVTRLAQVEDGVVGVVDGTLWFSGEGLPTHPILTLPGAITDVRDATVDDDGIGDLVVSGGSAVVLLRGRAGGGLAFGFGLEAPGWTATHVDVGDLDGDGLGDLLIAWETPTGPRIQVWSQELVADGGWAFAPLHERSLADVPQGIAVAHDRTSDLPVATWLVAGANWQRMVYLNGGFQLTGPQLQVGAVEGSSLRRGGDMNGDGVEELVVAGPVTAGAVRPIGVWDLGDDSASHTDFQPVGATLAIADVDVDGLRDLVLVDELGQCSAAVWRDTRYLVRDAAELSMTGPIAVGDRDADGVLDLGMGSDSRLAWWEGGIDPDDDSRWSPTAPGGTLWAREIRGELLWVDTDPGVDELALVARREDGLYLEHHRTGGTPELLGATRLAAPDQDLVDMAFCEGIVWVQLTGGVLGVDLAAGSVLWSDFLDEGETDVRAVTCQGNEVAFVDDYWFAGATWDGSVLDEHSNADHQDETVQDVALYWESGRWKIRTCVRCVWLPGPDGAEDGQLVSEDSADVLLSVQDVDGDGLPDIVRRDGPFVDVLRQMPDGSLAPRQGWHVAPGWEGAPVLGDAGGGRSGLWFSRPDALVVSQQR